MFSFVKHFVHRSPLITMLLTAVIFLSIIVYLDNTTNLISNFMDSGQSFSSSESQPEDLYLGVKILFPLIIIILLPFAMMQEKKFEKNREMFVRHCGLEKGNAFDVSHSSRLMPPKSRISWWIFSQKYKDAGITFYDCDVYIPPSHSGKATDVYTMLTVCEITISHSMPDMFFRAESENIPDFLSFDYKNLEKLSLEGDFDKYFTLFVEKPNPADALEFLTPDIMQELITYGSDVHIEIASGSVFIYAQGVEYDLKKLTYIHELAKRIVDIIERKKK